MNFKIPFIIAILFIAGCATTEYKPLPESPVKKAVEKPKGIYHKIKKGETLWRVAKSYGVSVEDIIAANNVPNAAAIEVNQLILIPGAKQVQDIPVAPIPAPPSADGVVSTVVDLNKDEFSWPLKGKVVAYFNDHKGDAINKGVDVEAASGDVVKASREGKVMLSDYLGALGYTVIIDHGDGFMSVYAQLAKKTVSLGARVSKGDQVGVVGQLGQKILLHFEIRKGQIAVNPLYYLP